VIDKLAVVAIEQHIVRLGCCLPFEKQINKT